MDNEQGMIRSMVRTTYDLQKLRIMTGNRVVASFKQKLGIAPGTKEEESEEDVQNFLERLRKDYTRITDGLVESRLPTVKKFQPGELITTYGELVLVDQYVKLDREEAMSFNHLGKVLEGYPLYTNFLSQVDGLGVQMAGVLISEIDIYRAKYCSSIWSYAGLDVVRVAYYVDEKGEEHSVSNEEVDAFYELHDSQTVMKVQGKYTVQFREEGRSRKPASLVKREYTDSAGKVAYRNSITFNPWLKTKLIGVLAGSILKRTKTLVDGEPMGSAKRMEFAKSLGFKPVKDEEVTPQKQADLFLKSQGHSVVFQPSQYGKIYYDYKNRLEHSPKHASKTPLHKHNMALRYMIKMFLIDYYRAARTEAGLPIYDGYAEAKLGLTHGRDPH